MSNRQSFRDNLDVCQDLQKLLCSQQTLSIATVSPEGISNIGYAPFVLDKQGCFYIYVSELAVHTCNLLRLPTTSVMVIRPEAEANNPYARERAIYQCQAIFIGRNEPLFALMMEAFSQRFGAVIDLLKSLSDFHLIQLRPENGRYVVGFGRAFAINTSDGSLTSISA